MKSEKLVERKIWIVDFGSQYTQLITRKSRELGYSSEIITLEECKSLFEKKEKPDALVLSGGPQSVFDDNYDYSFIFDHKELPILGICYGMQILGKYFEGKVERGTIGEYGHATIEFSGSEKFENCPSNISVWMSHSDHISVLPKNFEVVIKSENGLIAGIKHNSRKILGLQFHPEVEHSDHGKDILNHFFKNIAELESDWSASEMLAEATEVVKAIGDKKVLCAFSGGVDSLVAAMLAHHVLGDGLYCFFVDHGLLRPQDLGHIKLLQETLPLNIEIIDVKELFLSKLEGLADPEEKRKMIGNTFIEVFEKKVHEFEDMRGIKFDYLLQGTLYPDVIESISPHKKDGKSVTIKSHHNVGGLPERMKLKLLEPLRHLFKDEVRRLGGELGLEHSWVYRHPFPGPGLGIRILGEIFPESIRKVQESDQILFEELHRWGLYHYFR